MIGLLLTLTLMLAGAWNEAQARTAGDATQPQEVTTAAEPESAAVEEPESASDTTDRATAAADTTATPERLWDRANTAYINGDYHGAVEGYEAILAGGRSSVKLCYNLANSYFKEGRLGKAILFYHRALRMAPGNDDIRYNLQVAEARAKDKIEEIPEFFVTRWLRAVRHTMNCTVWSVLSLVMLACALGLTLLYLLAQRLSLRKAGFYGTLLAAALFVVTGWFALGDRRELLDDTQAVVMSASTAVKSSPDKSATDLFVLHEGTLVEVQNRLDGWCEVTIADGKKGWLEERTIETI